MKVIFMQNVPRVAKAGEIKEVADGYGRNFLIPKKLAQLANQTALSTLEVQNRKQARHQAEEDAKATALATALEGQGITLNAKVGTQDHLYGSITNGDIAKELQKTCGLSIDKKIIELEEPIRQLGSYEVSIKLSKDLVPKIKVTVVGEEEK